MRTGRPKYRKHCMWCGKQTNHFVWEKRKIRRVKVYCHEEHVGDWEMLKRRQKNDMDRVSIGIEKMLSRPSPWMQFLEGKK